MSDRSKIEWTDATWNVVIGCDKVSPGCDHCYAIRTAHRFQEHPNPVVASAYAGTEADGDWTGRVNLVESRLDLPLRWRRPRRIFVNAQSDLFHKNVPDEFIAGVWVVMARAPQHTFQILTKRHGRMRSLLNDREFYRLVRDQLAAAGWAEVDAYGTDIFPLRNAWLGVSVEDQKRADLRIPALLDTPAAVRWLSCEPLLGPVTLWDPETCDHTRQRCEDIGCWRALDWIVVGGESGPGARPMHPDWARSLRDQCEVAGVPFLFKQWGDWAPHRLDGGKHVNGRLSKARDEYESSRFAPDGTTYEANQPDLYSYPGMASLLRVGKRAAGRELDGRTWDEYPQEVSHA